MHTQGRPQADDPPTPETAPPPAPRLARHWRRTRALTAALLLLWALVSFVPVYFAAGLRQRFFGWPLGFWIASQGALVVFLAIVAVYAWAMGRIDADAGVAEER